ncbi:nucleotidyltransferase family protein [Erythrobacter sp. JK5]|uniref:nucleotidyltransferase family protein n=1 Tax=Erythrobacter sp. JK5 TaxID=2829500 RepID=UPI001BA9DB80|nr:nucleotidyltransferase family protein [Erythrobacter sp. JK5]QUL36899.1 nucleotidyltransferase family protein [Erythrobacter sp. JK5]
MHRLAPRTDGDRAFALLLACADRPRCERRNAAVREARAQLGADWGAFVREANRHHLAILACEGLRDADIEPPDELARIAASEKLRALELLGQGSRAIDRLGEAGIAAVFLKGPVLSETLYGDPAMRHSVDLDLLVSWRDFRPARAVLGELGYRLHGNEPPWDDWRIEPWRTLAKDIALIEPQQRFALELHHRLKTPDALLPGLGISQAMDTVSLAGKSFAAFGREDLFAYLCVHAATSLWDRLKWLADLRAMLADCDQTAIAALQAHSERLGTQRCTALGLLLCGRLWDQELPDRVADLERTDARLAQLLEASWQRLRGPQRRHSSIANSLQRRHLVHLRDDRAYRRALSRELVHDRELLERFMLPRALAWLYAPLRLWLFIRRKLGLIRPARPVGRHDQSAMRQNRPA